MKPFVIEPLVSGYKTIELRTTNLEKFSLCPMEFKLGKTERSSQAFEFGKIAHNAIQAYLFNPDIRKDILEFVCEYKEEYCDIIWSYLNLCDHEILDHWYKAILNEINWMIEIHCWQYKIFVEGTADLLLKREWVDWYIIWDIKTSKWGWKEWVLAKKLQKFVYTYLIWQKVWFDKIFWFEYMIFTKHKHPRFQCLGKYNITQKEIEQTIESLIRAYTYSLNHDDRPATKNDYCFFCSVKKEWKCPHYWWIDFNL